MNILLLCTLVCGEVLQTVFCDIVLVNITESTGIISSPDLDNDGYYDNNVDQIWRITTTEGSKITLEPIALSIEYAYDCRFDYLTFLSRKYLYGLFCGNYIPPDITTHGNFLTLEFVSDYNVTFGGFTVKFTEVAEAVCATVETLVMSTFGFIGAEDELYDNDLDCVWTIMSPLPLRQEYKQVYITYMNTMDYEACTFERIWIYDDDDEYANYYCGVGQPPLFNTSTRALFVKFHSDKPREGRGFSAVYTMTDKDAQCGGILLEPYGIITAPDDDQNGMYDPLKQCYWALIAPNSSVIEIQFTSMLLVDSPLCAQESVEFYDGELLSSAYVARYCGRMVPPTFLTQTNILYTLFRSTTDFDERNGIGFTMTYRHVNVSELLTTSTLTSTSIVTILAPLKTTNATTSAILTSDTTVLTEPTTEKSTASGSCFQRLFHYALCSSAILLCSTW